MRDRHSNVATVTNRPRPILHVEDDPDDVFLLQQALLKAGVDNPLQVATDGREALDYLSGTGRFGDRRQFPLPELVLLDFNLPNLSGLQVLQWIRQKLGPGIVVVLLTGSSDETEIEAAYRFGANAFIVKPSRASELIALAKGIKDFWLTYNTTPEEARPQAALASPVCGRRRARLTMKPRRSLGRRPRGEWNHVGLYK